jgi:hypothetical protein
MEMKSHKRRILARMWLLAMAAPVLLWGAPSQHTVSVTLNYDFTVDKACSATATTGCLKQFNIYDLTTGTPVS